VVAVVAGPAGRLASRIGYRPVLVAGASCFAGGLAWYVAFVDAEPAYLAHWLPGTLIVGLGIGLTFPVLSAAAVSSLPAHRYAVGSAVNQTARQVGGAIGIAVLVMLLGTPRSVPTASLASITCGLCGDSGGDLGSHRRLHSAAGSDRARDR
jgi:MFS family permease